MNRHLILTGWGLGIYPAAAALLLRNMCNYRATVKGVSQRHLAEELDRAKDSYDEIHVLGVGLTTNLEQLALALSKLSAQGVTTNYISSLELERPFAFSKTTAINDGDLLDAIEKHYALKLSAAEMAYFREHSLDKVSRKTDPGLYRLRFIAADWAHKAYRKLEPYSEAIRDLAAKTPANAFLNKSEVKKLLEDYERWGKRELIGSSEHINEIRRKIELAAKHEDANARVIILGPSGTGKETVAQQIHMHSKRRKNAHFESFNCACTTNELLEARLFGYVRGAFTGAAPEGKTGLFEEAEHGTLFLDEIGELSWEAQGQILRVLQEGEFMRVGDSTPRKVEDVRVITATNKDLGKLVREGKFREDLYYRLNVIKIRMRSLKDHPEDIPAIADHLWYSENHRHLTKDQIAALETYDFPGNVRELENMLIRAKALEIEDFEELVEEWKTENAEFHAPCDPISEPEKLEDVAKAHVKKIYAKYRGSVPRKRIALDILGVSDNTLKKYLRENA